MNIVELIEKKKSGTILSATEIDYIIQNYTSGIIPDYQMSAFLMTVIFKGMTSLEIANMTNSMISTGDQIDLSEIEGIKVDKHSTGGVGDKISLIIGPIIAALGVPFAKMSGRGLGHTGGTVDKLESIPNLKTELSEKEFINQVKKIGIAIISQTKNIVPADKKIYALRDVTATVDSIPLISASIMSKKIATGSDAILLDVKCGDGAFMKDVKSATELGKQMIEIGNHLNRDVKVEITNMDRPLGKTIGNKIEVLEAMDFLKGNYVSDLKEIIYSSGVTILLQSKKFDNIKDAEIAIKKVIDDGSAYKKFIEFITMQKGDIKKLESNEF
jgi:pyrimidine-nucleoside phosphorylase